ncbi:hypothetical protein JZ751_003639, partial [Albula glossodonta]
MGDNSSSGARSTAYAVRCRDVYTSNLSSNIEDTFRGDGFRERGNTRTCGLCKQRAHQGTDPLKSYIDYGSDQNKHCDDNSGTCHLHIYHSSDSSEHLTAINSSSKANEERKSEPIKGEASTSRTPALTTTRARLKTPKFIHVGDVDYSYDDEDVQYEKKADEVRRGDIPSCEYDFCAHMQRPCAELSLGRCLCPGLTPDSKAPSPPRKFHVETITPRSAQVRWCAPLSVVSGYELEVQREGGGATTSHSLDPTFRMFWVWDLEERQAYTVCVTAKNGAGSSVPACVPIATPAEGSAVLTYALGAAVAALAALALVLAICLCRH